MAKKASPNVYFYYEVETEYGPLAIVARDEAEVIRATVAAPLGYPPPTAIRRLRAATPVEIAHAKRSYLPAE
jgi:hypothetical protein